MLITMVHLILMFQPLTIALAVMISTVEEIKFLDGRTVKLKAGFYAVIFENGVYQISYYCDKCNSDWDKHSKTCILTLG